MSRKQIVRIEWTVLILVIIALIAGGIFVLSSRLKGSKRESQEQPESSGTSVSEELQGDSGTAESETVSTDLAADSGSAAEPKAEYLLSFAGDCTIGSLLEWQGSIPQDFQSVVGEDYAYPLSGVKEIFAADDFTAVNLEGTFTNSSNAVVKPYRFKADPKYVQVLAEGSVEAVSTANNHSGDFHEEGLQDTKAALDSAGILHTGESEPLIFTLGNSGPVLDQTAADAEAAGAASEGAEAAGNKTADGIRIGIVSYNTVDNPAGEYEWRASVQADINTCKEASCDLIIGFMHWGTVEYLTEPEAWEVQFAHDMADWGCDLIVGGHAHILQRMEYYNDVPIFYSMGNFCYGGNTNPDDKDSVIVQAAYSRDPETGTVTRSSLSVIPCLISTRTDLNDYCPTPCAEGSEDYNRILERLEWMEP